MTEVETLMSRIARSGKPGKDLMIHHGYVPATCTLPEEWAGRVIYAEVSAGRDACARCSADRAVCRGRGRSQ